MFTIIGGDGKEYGPVTVEQIRTWIASGRANLETQAKALGSDEWRRVGDFAEFAPAPSAPPMLPGVTPVAGTSATAGTSDPTLAHPGMRLLAAFIDGFLESLCWMPTSQAVLRSLGGLLSAGQINPQEITSAILSALPLSFPYLGGLILVQAILLTLRGQTVGKLITQLRVVRATDGSHAGFLRAFLLRGFLTRCIRHLPLIGVMFWLVDNCFIFRDDHRCIHDLIAGTKVVKA
jgi:uncharacterized RDD family membrane protein YckC